MKSVAILALLLTFPLFGEVVFSRRVYREQGASYQQIWSWNPASGALKELTSSPRNHYLPECKNGKINFVSPEPWRDDARLWSFDPANGEEREIGRAPGPPALKPPVNGCNAFAKTRDLEACGGKQDLTITRAGKQLKEFHIQTTGCAGPCETPIESLEWSADAKWLVVTELGLNTNSTAPQSDYYVVELSTMKLVKAASASEAVWLPGLNRLLYVTPRDTAALAGTQKERDVWVQQLMVFDPAAGKTRAITSGVTNNLNPAWCGR